MTFSAPWPSAGVTLVEVLAGLMLLATILMGILLTGVQYSRQAGDAERRIAASVVADQILSRWWEDLRKFPRSGSGAATTDGTWYWRTRVLDEQQIEEVPFQIVRLEMLDGRGGKRGNPVALAVDVVLPQPPNEEDQSNNGSRKK